MARISLRFSPLRPILLHENLAPKEVTLRQGKTVETKARVSFQPVENRPSPRMTTVRLPNQPVRGALDRPMGLRYCPTELKELVLLTLILQAEHHADSVLTSCSRLPMAAPLRMALTQAPGSDS